MGTFNIVTTKIGRCGLGIAIGDCTTQRFHNVAIGTRAGQVVGSNYAIRIGSEGSVNARGVSLGHQAEAGMEAVAIGAQARAYQGIAIGVCAVANCSAGAIAIGERTEAVSNGIAIGQGQRTMNHSIVIGTSCNYFTPERGNVHILAGPINSTLSSFLQTCGNSIALIGRDAEYDMTNGIFLDSSKLKIVLANKVYSFGPCSLSQIAGNVEYLPGSCGCACGCNLPENRVIADKEELRDGEGVYWLRIELYGKYTRDMMSCFDSSDEYQIDALMNGVSIGPSYDLLRLRTDSPAFCGNNDILGAGVFESCIHSGGKLVILKHLLPYSFKTTTSESCAVNFTNAAGVNHIVLSPTC